MSSTMQAPNPTDTDVTALLPQKLARSRSLFDGGIVRTAVKASFGKLNPATLIKNPFMFRDIIVGGRPIGFQLQISLWLRFTVLFANFAEAMAEARGKAQADTLRKAKTDSPARRCLAGGDTE